MIWVGIFGSALAVGLSGAMAPGSLLVANIQASAQEGYRGGLKLVTGHAVLELVLTVLLIFGLSSVLAADGVAAGISLMGAAVLLWMGYTTVRDAWQDKLQLEMDEKESENFKSLTLLGVIATVSNPYWLLWWATIGAGYVVLSQRQAGFGGLVSFYFGHISADFLWYMLITMGVVSGRKFISQGVYRALLISCGGLLLMLAAYFIYSGIGLLS